MCAFKKHLMFIMIESCSVWIFPILKMCIQVTFRRAWKARSCTSSKLLPLTSKSLAFVTSREPTMRLQTFLVVYLYAFWLNVGKYWSLRFFVLLEIEICSVSWFSRRQEGLSFFKAILVVYMKFLTYQKMSKKTKQI